MIFDPKKGDVILWTFFDPPSPNPSLKKRGRPGVPTKKSLGDAFIGQNKDFTRD